MIIKDLPKNWQFKELESLLSFVIGGDWGKDENFEDPDYDFAYCIRGSEIKNWDVEKGLSASLRKIKKTNIEKRKLKDGDILVEISGGGPEQPVGRTILIDRISLLQNKDIPKISTNFLRLIRPIDNVNSNYLNLFLKLFYYSGEIVKYQAGSNNLRNLKFPDYLKIKIPIPPLQTQQAIVSKIEELFSALDKGIEDLKTAQQQLKTYRQSVLKWAFEGKLTNENLKDEELPEGWEIKKLKDVSILITKGASPKWQGINYTNDKSQVLFITSENVRENFIDVSKPKYLESAFNEKQKRSILNYGDILINIVGASIGRAAIFNLKTNANINQAVSVVRLNEKVNNVFVSYFLNSNKAFSYYNLNKVDVARANLSLVDIGNIEFLLPPLKEQYRIVKEIESRLSVADKMEESIAQSLQQAEALRQSILKKAFSGELVKEAVKEKVYKPKNDYFFQMQLIGKIAAISNKNNIEHGEMTIAKYAYLSDKIYNIPSGFTFERWHLGPYPLSIKKVINNKQYFKRENNHIYLVNEKTLFNSINDYTVLIDNAVSDLVSIFSKYKTNIERAHKTELLATVCKVIEDIKTTDLKSVRTSMKEWKIQLKTSSFKNKAEKFNEEETKNCIEFIINKGWDKKLIS